MRKEKDRLQKGQTLVEFSLIVVILLLLAFVIMESGRILFAWNAVQNAARAGARYGITGQINLAYAADPNPRVASIKAAAEEGLAGLRLEEGGLYEDDYFYNIEVWGTPITDTSQLYPNNAGGPGLPLVVRVTYRVPIIAPILSGIVSSIPVYGQVVLNNEQFGSLGGSDQGQGLPPPLPIIPTPGPTPTPTSTPTPGPSNTPTPTSTGTSTATPVICPTQWEGELIAGELFGFVTGEIGETVYVVDLTTGETYGSDVLVAADGHACPGFADFVPDNLFSQPLVFGHVMLVSSSNGTQDTMTVTPVPATAQPTNTSTATIPPTPTNTVTPTPSYTPINPFIVLSASCGIGPAVQFNIFGYNWPDNLDVSILFDNNLQTIIPSGHGGTFATTITSPSLPPGNHVVWAYALGGIEDTADYLVPCPNITPTPPTSTPTATPAPADLVFVAPPVLLSTGTPVEYLPLDFSVQITNAGDIDINDQFFVDIFFDPPEVYTDSIPTEYTVGYASISQLPGGQGRTLFIRTFSGFEGGLTEHDVYGMVDSLQEIGEGVETNNITYTLDIDVIPGVSPTPSPTAEPGPNMISGVVKARLGDWFKQNRAIVTLRDPVDPAVILATTFSDDNGYYEFTGLPDGTYTVYGCQLIDNVWFQGLRVNIPVPPSNNLVDLWLRDLEQGLCE